MNKEDKSVERNISLKIEIGDFNITSREEVKSPKVNRFQEKTEVFKKVSKLLKFCERNDRMIGYNTKITTGMEESLRFRRDIDRGIKHFCDNVKTPRKKRRNPIYCTKREKNHCFSPMVQNYLNKRNLAKEESKKDIFNEENERQSSKSRSRSNSKNHLFQRKLKFSEPRNLLFSNKKKSKFDNYFKTLPVGKLKIKKNFNEFITEKIEKKEEKEEKKKDSSNVKNKSQKKQIFNSRRYRSQNDLLSERKKKEKSSNSRKINTSFELKINRNNRIFTGRGGSFGWISSPFTPPPFTSFGAQFSPFRFYPSYA